jgi:hypothetical protein
VEALVLLGRAVEQAHADAQVAHDARADEARLIERGPLAVDLEDARHGREHALCERAAGERAREDARDDARGAAIPARAFLVIDLEEARHEPRPHDEADARRVLVGAPQRRARGARRAARPDRAEQPRRVVRRVSRAAREEAPTVKSPVARDRAHGPARRERDWGQLVFATTCLRERTGERRDSRHVGAVAAREDDRVGNLPRDRLGRRAELGHRVGLDHAHAWLPRAQHLEEGA